MYVVTLLYAFVKVGDDLIGPKVFKTSSQRQRRGRSIRFWSWIDELGWRLAIKQHRDQLSSFACVQPGRLQNFVRNALTTSTATERNSLATTMSPKAPSKAPRPPPEPILIAPISPALHHSVASNHRHTTSLFSTATSPPNTSSSELSRHDSSPSRRRSHSRRQSSISYFPADSPRLWTPRTSKKGSSALKRGASLPSKKEGRANTGSVSQRPIHEPAVLTLADKYAFFLALVIIIRAHIGHICVKARGPSPVHRSERVEMPRTPFPARST